MCAIWRAPLPVGSCPRKAATCRRGERTADRSRTSLKTAGLSEMRSRRTLEFTPVARGAVSHPGLRAYYLSRDFKRALVTIVPDDELAEPLFVMNWAADWKNGRSAAR